MEKNGRLNLYAERKKKAASIFVSKRPTGQEMKRKAAAEGRTAGKQDRNLLFSGLVKRTSRRKECSTAEKEVPVLHTRPLIRNCSLFLPL